MKRLFIVLFVTILLCSCHKETITSYYLFTYTPPNEVITSPKVTVKQLDYSNDSIAIITEKNRILSQKKGIIEYLSKEYSKGPAEGLAEKSNRQALESVLSEINTLMCLTYAEGYEPEEFIEIAKKYGVESKEVKNFIEDNELTVKFIPLN